MRLQKINLSMSHNVTTDLITHIGKEHDKQVIEWRDSLIRSLEDEVGIYTLIYNAIVYVM